MKHVLKATVLTCCVALFTGCTKSADTVIYGNIYVDNSTRAQSLAIKDGIISYTGTKEGVQKYIGKNTTVTDYEDNFVLPGFIDGHIHSYIDAENQAGFILTDCPKQTQEEYLKTIREYINAHPEQDSYQGFGWLDSAFIGGTPTAAMLDEICADKPIFIKSEDCHSCWINTKLLEKTGITSSTPNPIGGKIEHDDNGNPNGCFRDTAMDKLVKPYVPVYSVEQYEEVLYNAQKKLLSYGYTAYNDVIIDPQSADNICQAYYNLDKKGKLLCDTNVSVLIDNTPDYIKDLEHIVTLSKKLKSTNFAITDVKIFMDGIVESETAYVSEPYIDSNTYGADRWPEKEDVQRLNDLTKRINDAGLVAHFHAIGDAAITKALDALEYAKTNSKNKNIRNCMTHFQMISANDIKRMTDLNVIAVADLGWAPSISEEAGSQNIELLNVGQKRNEAMYPYASMITAGVFMSYATDYPAGPIVNPLYNLPAGITRQILNYSTTIRNSSECITPEQAITCITQNGAYQLGRENALGKLEPKKEADFIILNQDITKADPKNIYFTTKIIATYADGVKQFGL